MTAFDVAVVGGGVAGLLAAARAARSGARTLLLDRGPGGERARREPPCCGLLLSEAFEPYASRRAALGAAAARALRESALSGRRLLAAALSTRGRSLAELPLARIADDPRDAALLRESERALREDGFVAEFLEAGEAADRLGLVAPEGAFLVPREAGVDPAELRAALLEAARDAGAAVRAGVAVLAIRPREDLEFDLRLATGGTVRAARVLLAPGPRLARLDPFGAEAVTPLRVPWVRLEGPRRAPAAIFASRGAIRAFLAADGTVRAAGLARAPAKQDFALGNRCDPEDLDRLQDRLEAVSPSLRGASRAATGGAPIALPCDGLPVVGEHPRRPGILLAAGFGADDTALAAFAGDALGTTLLEGRAPIPSILSPRRMA